MELIPRAVSFQTIYKGAYQSDLVVFENWVMSLQGTQYLSYKLYSMIQSFDFILIHNGDTSGNWTHAQEYSRVPRAPWVRWERYPHSRALAWVLPRALPRALIPVLMSHSRVSHMSLIWVLIAISSISHFDYTCICFWRAWIEYIKCYKTRHTGYNGQNESNRK
jgi:hypothetical protein